MQTSQFYLTKTTFDEIAEDLDNLSLYQPLLVSSLDPQELKRFNLEPYEFYVVVKIRFEFQNEDAYSVLIRHMSGSHVETKGIDILSDGNIDDYDLRQYGIRMFIQEYYEKHMGKNSTGDIYYFNQY